MGLTYLSLRYLRTTRRLRFICLIRQFVAAAPLPVTVGVNDNEERHLSNDPY